jgi:hypothetical protein
MIHRHYKALTTAKEAEAWFSIAPPIGSTSQPEPAAVAAPETATKSNGQREQMA